MSTDYAALIEAAFQKLLRASDAKERGVAGSEFTRLIRERNAGRSAGTIASMEKRLGLRE